MKIGHIAIVLIALFAVGFISAEPQQTSDLFSDEKEGILMFQNQTGADIILFADRVENGIVLGGIRANSTRNFDISKIGNIPWEGAFIAYGVLAETYYRKPLPMSGDVLYSGLVVFDLENTMNIEKTIPNEIDETMSFSIYVSNYSRSICNLRLDAPDGPEIATLRPGERNREIWIKPHEFGMPRSIWPIFTSFGSDGTVNESIPYDRVRFNPVPRGSNIMVIEFNNPDEY